MQKMAMNETELATRWNISPKTLQRWRSERHGPRFIKRSERVVYRTLQHALASLPV